jgi:hypothetical protein
VEKAAKVAAQKKDVDGQRFDADFYIGQWALISRRRSSRAPALSSRSYDSRMREYLEFDIARADLDNLGTLAITRQRPSGKAAPERADGEQAVGRAPHRDVPSVMVVLGTTPRVHPVAPHGHAWLYIMTNRRDGTLYIA